MNEEAPNAETVKVAVADGKPPTAREVFMNLYHQIKWPILVSSERIQIGADRVVELHHLYDADLNLRIVNRAGDIQSAKVAAVLFNGMQEMIDGLNKKYAAEREGWETMLALLEKQIEDLTKKIQEKWPKKEVSSAGTADLNQTEPEASPEQGQESSPAASVAAVDVMAAPAAPPLRIVKDPNHVPEPSKIGSFLEDPTAHENKGRSA